jgi:hypothetical protein
MTIELHPELAPVARALSPQNAVSLLPELQCIGDPSLFPLLNRVDGAPLAVDQLRRLYHPECVRESRAEGRTWELVGLVFLRMGRSHDALLVFRALYDTMLLAQRQTRERVHKGMPLCWIADCYDGLNYPALAKRALMLTLCEDALNGAGSVAAGGTGVYFRLVWHKGLPDVLLRRYATAMFESSVSHPRNAFYPEWVLSEMDQEWMTEVPSLAEAMVYHANTRYVSSLLDGLDDKTGKRLERLASYVLSCMPGCRTARRARTPSTDYDIVCSMQGLELDFRSELGRYFVCECKDWNEPADFATVAKFCRVLDSIKSRFGILFSSQGITGAGGTKAGEREQLKVFQDRGMVLVVVDRSDLQKVADGANFIGLLRSKYERVRLDLSHPGTP